MFDFLFKIFTFAVVMMVLAIVIPIAMLSVGIEAGKDIYNGRKIKIWGFD